MNEKAATRITTGKVRMSYAKVFEPASYEGGPLKYSVSILIPKDAKWLGQLKAAIDAAKQQWKEKYGAGKLPAVNFKMPLRDGDLEHGPDSEKPDENYEGMWFVSCNSTRKPEVVNMKGKKLEPEEFYSGCYGKVSINFFPYNKKGRGVAAGLGNCCFLEDGPALSGGASAAEDFGIEKEADEFDDDL